MIFTFSSKLRSRSCALGANPKMQIDLIRVLICFRDPRARQLIAIQRDLNYEAKTDFQNENFSKIDHPSNYISLRVVYTQIELAHQ
ncbi:hypothetical protein CEXT_548501 [Caerostris extrusa]|uniref:Uncharacterized protein n=1 Tax=Caerostris extrusa TaxID=172846 RepID=A0AAV4Y7T7_CAEEX|nr:hypothetical protein CEXT_548501 [Caerostris extrusa]